MLNVAKPWSSDLLGASSEGQTWPGHGLGVRDCPLLEFGEEQMNICASSEASDSPRFYIKALAGVGKTALRLLNTIRFSVAHCYKQNPEDNNKVIIVLVPSRELRHDLRQDVINTGVFQSEAMLWLGRPPGPLG
jgi:hypothetical protein